MYNIRATAKLYVNRVSDARIVRFRRYSRKYFSEGCLETKDSAVVENNRIIIVARSDMVIAIFSVRLLRS